ncbi:hypothetical protein ZIOFF_018001 [Zingiber officinale]|uniref:Uncharacterized protein n=1 Tax=Zingiber officinale TaxID=94328 RepID=A0A8J5HPP5_ZINOF|nr:hypothetical protein ZIOFF_018001 [Zingiber officinale]
MLVLPIHCALDILTAQSPLPSPFSSSGCCRLQRSTPVVSCQPPAVLLDQPPFFRQQLHSSADQSTFVNHHRYVLLPLKRPLSARICHRARAIVSPSIADTNMWVDVD